MAVVKVVLESNLAEMLMKVFGRSKIEEFCVETLVKESKRVKKTKEVKFAVKAIEMDETVKNRFKDARIAMDDGPRTTSISRSSFRFVVLLDGHFQAHCAIGHDLSEWWFLLASKRDFCIASEARSLGETRRFRRIGSYTARLRSQSMSWMRVKWYLFGQGTPQGSASVHRIICAFRTAAPPGFVVLQVFFYAVVSWDFLLVHVGWSDIRHRRQRQRVRTSTTSSLSFGRFLEPGTTGGQAREIQRQGKFHRIFGIRKFVIRSRSRHGVSRRRSLRDSMVFSRRSRNSRSLRRGGVRVVPSMVPAKKQPCQDYQRGRPVSQKFLPKVRRLHPLWPRFR